MQNDNIQLMRENSYILIGYKNISASCRDIPPTTIVLLIANVDTRSEILTHIHYTHKYMKTNTYTLCTRTQAAVPCQITLVSFEYFSVVSFFHKLLYPQMLNETRCCLLYSRDFYSREWLRSLNNTRHTDVRMYRDSHKVLSCDSHVVEGVAPLNGMLRSTILSLHLDLATPSVCSTICC